MVILYIVKNFYNIYNDWYMYMGTIFIDIRLIIRVYTYNGLIFFTLSL